MVIIVIHYKMHYRYIFFSTIPTSNFDSCTMNTQNVVTPYIVPPVMLMSSSSSGSNLKQSNSMRKKGRFRVRRVSKTPEGSKDNIKREKSSSPVKSVSIAMTSSITPNVISSQLADNQSTYTSQTKRDIIDVTVYDVSKLFSKSYDNNLAANYILDESGT